MAFRDLQAKLPSQRLDVVRPLLENVKYISHEGQFWDFKREWPVSYSDDYFCRNSAIDLCFY
jgi:hypothetical protein